MRQKFTCLASTLAMVALAASMPANAADAIISLPESALPMLSRANMQVTALAQPKPYKDSLGESIRVVRVSEAALPGLSEAIHADFHRCAGFVRHASEEDALAWLSRAAHAPMAKSGERPIDAGEMTRPLIAELTEARLLTDIRTFSELRPNRSYTTADGRLASDWLAAQWRSLAADRKDITVETVPLSGFPNRQETVVLSIRGSEKPNDVIVIGSHLDSIAAGNIAPGADDDASGVASATSIIRAMVARGYRPQRTIRFIAHAAEEGGLIGSQQIARQYKATGIHVVGMMQLDMTAYKGARDDINLMTDYTDAGQNDFVETLVQSYLPGVTVGRSKCGYACSDHAAWNNAGYPVSMPFEATLGTHNRHIHTPRDTVAGFGDSAAHAIKFARLGMAFAVELAND